MKFWICQNTKDLDLNSEFSNTTYERRQPSLTRRARKNKEDIQNLCISNMSELIKKKIYLNLYC